MADKTATPYVAVQRIPHLRIIMVTSGLTPPKATVKALTVTKKAVPDGASSKFRIRLVPEVFRETEELVSEVFCESETVPEMETM